MKNISDWDTWNCKEAIPREGGGGQSGEMGSQGRSRTSGQKGRSVFPISAGLAETIRGLGPQLAPA